MHGFSKAVIESAEVMAVRFNKRIIPALCSIVTMVILILDSKTSLAGVAEGIDLCLKVVIPSLFPFLILSTVLTESTSGMSLRFVGAIVPTLQNTGWCCAAAVGWVDRRISGGSPMCYPGMAKRTAYSQRCPADAWFLQ